MDGSGQSALSGLPRDRSGEGVIQFEDAWSITKLLQLPSVGNGDSVFGHAQQLARCHIQQRDPSRWQRGKILNRRMGADFAAE